MAATLSAGDRTHENVPRRDGALAEGPDRDVDALVGEPHGAIEVEPHLERAPECGAHEAQPPRAPGALAADPLRAIPVGCRADLPGALPRQLPPICAWRHWGRIQGGPYASPRPFAGWWA